MFHLRLIVLSLCVLMVYTSGYGGAPKSKGSYGSGFPSVGGGYGGGSFDSAAFAHSDRFTSRPSPATGQVVSAAIQTRHEVEFRDVLSSGSVQPTVVEVGASSLPLQILFRSASSNLNINQVHDGAQGSVQESQSEDEPHRLVHSVKKPIIQEVHEVITPYRKITQEIQPVQEEIQTIVARSTSETRGSGATSMGASLGKGLGGGLGGDYGSGFKSSSSYNSGVSFQSSSKSY